ncbi:MAG: HEAT repeat domain-containing protein [Patescibacteria group bacterium]|nr:HEAT repeat domain-containing protein [Patescibacteria group bacterium]
MDSISYLLDYLENIIDDPNKKEEKKLAVSALNRMIEKNTDKAFTRYRSIELLKKLFVQENSKSIKIEIIRYFASIGEVSLVPFLLDTLGTEDEEMLADSIATIGTFKDPNIYPYLKKFLTHKNPYILANTMIALWSFKSYRLRLMGHAVRLAMSKDVDTKKAFIYMIGETQGHQEKEKMYQYLEDEDQEIRKQASIALAKL